MDKNAKLIKLVICRFVKEDMGKNQAFLRSTQRTLQSLTDAFFEHRAFCFRRLSSIRQYPIIIRKVFKKSQAKWGVKGMLPLGCLPLGEREGVTLIIGVENK